MIDISHEPIILDRKDVLRISNLSRQSFERLLKARVFPQPMKRKNKNAKQLWHRGKVEAFLNEGYQPEPIDQQALVTLIDARLVEILRQPNSTMQAVNKS